ncbi:hypothetical protein TGAM01_v210921 [Trichoderma gamsii]|uniref:Endonuclease/exonuclease/phosphatase domain-containing protein n=1 Tax=Trichoderma gamsii TaxID=398673 RepID=A0A2P4Z7E7_9HYPO|nr:hypothetical protein TGAM01_v210921 [Trichoderma gamsii]PON20200.1 hypothetical protein TGAM01_v210921 [Trichoderma gamsii]
MQFDSLAMYPSRESRLMALELKCRGDFRNVDDLSDFEFNDLYLDAMSGSLEFMDDTANKTFISQSLTDQQTSPSFLQPQIYNPQSSSWAPFSNEARTLRRGDVLKIASWNLFFSVPAAAARAAAAIAYLRTMFGQEPHNLVVLFQELRQESLEAILEDKWTQQNFVLSDTEPPYFDYADNESFDEKPDRIPSRYFTLMISRNLPISNCFRVPFVSKMERDALVVDFPVSKDHGPEASKRPLRLCTTHLESLYTEKELRFRQLVQVSALLKGDSPQEQRIYGGLVGGDMNSVDPSEHNTHRAPEVGLKDVWEDEPAPTPPALKPFQKDITYGKARGNTWGYQSDRARTRKRLDKFLYRVH